MQPKDASGDRTTPSDLTMLRTKLEAQKERCNDPLEQDLIQDYLEDLLCLTDRQQLLKATQEMEPERVQSGTRNADKQIPQNQVEEVNSINDELCKALGIEEIPWQQSKSRQAQLPLEVPETYKNAARRLGLFRPTALKAAEPKELHKKGIKAPTKGISDALT